MVLNLRKKKQIIKVEGVELPYGIAVVEVDTLEKLEKLKHGQTLIETPGDFYLISSRGELAFHCSKPGLPKVIQVERLELNPDGCLAKAELNEQTLFDFAKKQSLFLFETQDGFYLPSTEVVFYSRKAKQQ